MSKGFVVELKPFSLEERKDRSKIEAFQEHSIKGHVAGMGWAEKGIREVENPTIDDLKRVIKELPEKDRYSTRMPTVAYNCYKDMECGDYLFTRLSNNSMCYIGKVTSNFRFLSNGELADNSDFENYDHYTWIVDVNWKEIDYFTKIPGALRGLIQGRIPTVKRITEENTVKIMENLYENSQNRIPIDSSSFCSALDSDDLENLVYFYICHHNPDYILLPSTCKSSEPMVEFALYKNGKYITLQVKNKEEIDAKEYSKMVKRFEKIYLFSGLQVKNLDACPDNVIIISHEELFSFLKENIKTNGYFNQVLSQYYIIKE